jgi:hypothetical protein
MPPLTRDGCSMENDAIIAAPSLQNQCQHSHNSAGRSLRFFAAQLFDNPPNFISREPSILFSKAIASHHSRTGPTITIARLLTQRQAPRISRS